MNYSAPSLRFWLTLCLSALCSTILAQTPAEPWDNYSDTWTATDGLGRALLTSKSGLPPPRSKRTVGMFYFLTFDRGGGGPYDNAKILKAHPEAMMDVHNPAWGPLNASHYWGQPLFGYYASDDEWVLRKHAQMLSNAGVDVVIFDNSNAVTYDKARRTLCRVWEKVRSEGGRTPQIAFLCPFGNPGGIGSSTLSELYDTLYEPGLYSDLWFRWEGKPLIMADPGFVTQLDKSGTDLKSAERARKIRSFFTFRTPIGPYDLTVPPPGSWAWLQNFPQALQRSPAGAPEQITVGVAQNYNAVTHLAPMSFPGAFGRSYHQGKQDSGPDAVRQGFNFSEQWQRALQVDPPFVFITGWNEWTAGFYEEWAGYKSPPPIFVDEFSQEFSRDIEPMRDGHGDDYYYQLVGNIRRYKGVRALPPISHRTIPMNGRFDAWKGVVPEFRDYVGDTAHREAGGSGAAGPYKDSSGRNDIIAAKVSYDEKNVYFYVRTRDQLTLRTDPDWMLLYINADSNPHTGWLGYDYVINRQVGSSTTSIERCIGGRYAWKKIGDVSYRLHGNEMELAIPRRLLGITSLPATLEFKWADHCFAKGDWTDFTLHGDAAPDDRFNYRARLEPLR